MIEPMIVVEGNLRLPTVRLLTDPSLSFGFEWSPVHTRPVQSQFEIALFAARFKTAYVPAFWLSDTDSSYRPLSLWGVLAQGDLPPSVMSLIQGRRPDERDEDIEESRVDPLRLSAAAWRSASTRGNLISRPVLRGAAAVAGAVLIVWILFGHAPAPSGRGLALPVDETALRPRPAAPASAPVDIALAQTAMTRAPTAGASMATPAVAPGSGAVSAASLASAASPKARSDGSRVLATRQAAPAETANQVASTRRDASSHAMAAKPNHRDTGRPKAARPQRPAYASTRAYTSDERIAAVESGYGAHAASSRHIGGMTPKPLDAMSPQELYSLLQHSPTLDSNVSASGARDPRAGGAPAY